MQAIGKGQAIAEPALDRSRFGDDRGSPVVLAVLELVAQTAGAREGAGGGRVKHPQAHKSPRASQYRLGWGVYAVNCWFLLGGPVRPTSPVKNAGLRLDRGWRRR